MNEDMNNPIAVGDALVFDNSVWKSIRTVERITKSGRIICGGYTLNPDLSIRGENSWNRINIYRATDEIKAGINQEQVERKLRAKLHYMIRNLRILDLTFAQIQSLMTVLDEIKQLKEE